MHLLNLIQSQYYPYHLSWEELNDPGIVVQKFFSRWELPECRILLAKYYQLLKKKTSEPDEIEYLEIREFIGELERMIEAVYIIRLQFDETKKLS